MRYCLLLFFCTKAFFSSAQAVDISPQNVPPNTWFNDFYFDTKGGMYVLQHSSGAAQVDYFNGTSWFKVEGIKGEPIGVYLYNEELYVLSRRRSDDYYFLNYSKTREAGWDSIPVTSLKGYVLSVVMLPGHELLAKGRFTDAKGEYFLAKWSGNSWKPFRPKMNDSLKLAMQKFTTLDPVTDKRGNVYYYTWATYPLSELFKVLRCDGNSLDFVGTDYNSEVTSIAATSNGKLYGDLMRLTPPAIEEWDGSQWHQIFADLSVFHEPWIGNITVNDKDEVLASGNGRKDIENAIVKYSNGSWYPFATIPPGSINGLYFGSGSLYAAVGTSIYKVSGDEDLAAKEATKKVSNAQRVDVNADEVWKIYNGYLSFTKSVGSSMNSYIGEFNKADDENVKSIAGIGGNISSAWAKMARAFKKVVTDLNIPDGKNILVPALLKDIESVIELTEQSATAFSAYLTKPKEEYNSAKAAFQVKAENKKKVATELDKTAAEYKKRNSL